MLGLEATEEKLNTPQHDHSKADLNSDCISAKTEPHVTVGLSDDIPEDGPDLVFMTSNEDGKDELLLNNCGKRQDVKRVHRFWSLFGLTTGASITWVCVLLSFDIALDNGGTPSMVWGLTVCWLGGLAIAASMAELASIAPVNAGQYHWVWMLAPERHKKWLSWFTGWVTFAGWTGNVAATNIFVGEVLVAMLQISNTNYRPDAATQRWQVTLIGLAGLVISFVYNSAFSNWMPKLGKTLVLFQMAVFLAVFIPLVAFSPERMSAKEALIDFQLSSGWESKGLAFMIGMSAAELALIGVDIPSHFAEETKNAAIAVPRAMWWSYFASGLTGIVMACGFAFCLSDIRGGEESLTGYIFVEVMDKAIGSTGVCALLALMVSLFVTSDVIFLASASRQLRGFTRDNGLPGSPWLKELTTVRGIPTPVRCIALSTVISLIFDLVYVASTEAFVSLTSLTIGGMGLSFMIPIVLIAMKRIMPVQGEGFQWGRWRMSLFSWQGPALGLSVNLIALASLFINVLFSFFPYYLPVTPSTLNWSAPSLAAICLIGVVYWFCAGRKVYRGVVHEQDVFAVPVAIFL